MSIARGLVGWWRFDGNLTDASGNGNNGTVGAGSAAYAEGKYGQAWDNDTTRFVNCGNDESVQITENLSLSCWVKRKKDASGVVAIATKWMSAGGNDNRSWAFWMQSNRPRFLISTTGADNVSISANDLAPLNEWIHYVAHFNGSKISLYVNGVLDVSTNVSGSLYNSTANFLIGAVNVNAFRGNIDVDNAMIYNRALTPSEIKTLYALGSPL